MSGNYKEKTDFELRRVQAYSGEKSLLLVLPKLFSERLNIHKGDYLSVKIQHDSIIVKKTNLGS